MKVIHIPFGFYPDPVGGTEVYVSALAQLLQEEHGVDVLVAAPGERGCEYSHEGLRVRRFAVAPNVENLAELYGEGDAYAAQEFEKILEKEKPDIVHLHAFTRGVSLRVARAAKAHGARVLLTYHTPTVSCVGGTMMRWGTEPCDGLMDARTCAACTLHSKGLPRVTARALASFNFQFSTFNFRAATPLRMRSLIELRHRTTRALFAEVDHIIAVCEWVRAVLLRNGVPAKKITLSRQGVTVPSPSSALTASRPRLSTLNFPLSAFSPCRPLRLCFLGRLDPTKGLHLVISALRSLPAAPITLDIYGVAQAGAAEAYVQRIRRLAASDVRIRWCEPVPSSAVTSVIGKYDFLVVPSEWLETGPLVALEALAAGVPVLGTKLGGIAELLQDRKIGWLVEPHDASGWRNALLELIADPQLLASLRNNITPPRTMRDAANEMASLYVSLEASVAA